MRELKHVVKRAVLLEENDHISTDVLKLEISTPADSYRESLDNYYRLIIEEGYKLSDVTTKVNNKMDTKMVETYHNVAELAHEKNIDMRTAAYILAIQRIQYAHNIK